MRLWFTEEDAEARARMARTALGTVAAVTTLVGARRAAVRGAARRRCCATGTTRASAASRSSGSGASRTSRRPTRSCAWRSAGRRTSAASMANVLLTVALTVTLVVFLDGGAHGLPRGQLRGQRRRAARAVGRPRCGGSGCEAAASPLGPLLRYGLPIVPAEAAVFALNVVDRAYLLRDGVGRRRRPLRARGEARDGRHRRRPRVRPRVAAAGVLRRRRRRGPPPLRHRDHVVRRDHRPRRARAGAARRAGSSTSWRHRTYAAAHEALGWVALGWGLYGLALLLVTVAGRARVTTRNIAGRVRPGSRRTSSPCSCSCPPLGIAGAGLALCVAYVVTLAILHLLTRGPCSRSRSSGGASAHATVVLARRGARRRAAPARRGVGRAGVARRPVALAVPSSCCSTGFLRPERAPQRSHDRFADAVAFGSCCAPVARSRAQHPWKGAGRCRKSIRIVTLAVALVFVLASVAAAAPPSDTVIVKFRTASSAAERATRCATPTSTRPWAASPASAPASSAPRTPRARPPPRSTTTRASLYAEVNRRMRAAVEPNDPLFAASGRCSLIGAPTAWDARALAGFPTGGGPVVGIVDSGVRTTHEDLRGAISGCLSASTTDAGSNVADGGCEDDNGHGTHVTGTIVSRAGNGLGHRRPRLQLDRDLLQGARREQRRPHVRHLGLHRRPARPRRPDHQPEPRRPASDTL